MEAWMKKIDQGDWWLFGPEIAQLIEAVRKDEREKAAQIVEQWSVDVHHIVQKERLKERRAAIAKTIRGKI